MVVLPAVTLDGYGRFSQYNSPYPAHDAGAAVDLYPEGDVAPSPVAGEVIETRRVQCPSRPHAESHDYLVVVDTGSFLARILHVEPSVEPGDAVARGDSLGRLVRSGYFAPWVDNHVHLGVRPQGSNVLRATVGEWTLQGLRAPGILLAHHACARDGDPPRDPAGGLLG